jgi:hypothetical protein
MRDLNQPRKRDVKSPGDKAGNGNDTDLGSESSKLQALQTEKDGTDSSSERSPSKSIFSTTTPSYRDSQKTVNHRDIPGKMKINYMHGIGDQTQKSLDGVQKLLAHFRKPHLDTDKLIQEAANFVWRQLGIDGVAIGLRDPKDKLYRYKIMVGFRDDVVEAHKRIAYTREQFFDTPDFVGSDISDLSRIYLAEDNPPSEEDKQTYNRPGLLSVMKRRTSADSVEGDYIDTKIYGANDTLLGWIEISGTRTMKLPSVTTIRWIELIASIIGAALMCVESHKTLA